MKEWGYGGQSANIEGTERWSKEAEKKGRWDGCVVACVAEKNHYFW